MGVIGTLMLGIVGVSVVYAAASLMDTVVGQPRTSGGQFAPNRTTKIENLLAALGGIACLVLVIDIFFGDGAILRALYRLLV
jgi:hypothetical protein